MRINMFGTLTGHLHLCYTMPAADVLSSLAEFLPGIEAKDTQFHLDLKLVEDEDDGDPVVEVKWDLPGTAFDSGPDPKIVKIPAAMMKNGLADVIGFALASAGAPLPLVGMAKGFLTA